MKNRFIYNPLIKSKGFYLHASAININGKAILFLGHSGSGKSTIVKLLSTEYQIIADDKVWMSKHSSGEWYVHSLWNEINPIMSVTNKNRFKHRYPLNAIIRIHKADNFVLKKISEEKSCKDLIFSIFEIYLQRDEKRLKIRKEWFCYCSELSRMYKGLELFFKNNKKIVDFFKLNLKNDIF